MPRESVNPPRTRVRPLVPWCVKFGVGQGSFLPIRSSAGKFYVPLVFFFFSFVFFFPQPCLHRLCSFRGGSARTHDRRRALLRAGALGGLYTMKH